jgi:hypothetical protein
MRRTCIVFKTLLGKKLIELKKMTATKICQPQSVKDIHTGEFAAEWKRKSHGEAS